MKAQHIINSLRSGVVRKGIVRGTLCLALAAFAACSDWTDHYDDMAGSSPTAGMSIYEQIAADNELSQFCTLIDRVHLYENNRPTTLTYGDVLRGDQFMTVWVPKNGTFNLDSLLGVLQTAGGDSLVGEHFIADHMARYRHMQGTNERVLMLNGKTKHLAMNYMDGALMEKANVPASNGILHVLKGDYQYHYNIYEYLLSHPSLSHIGNFLRRYQVDEFSPEQSLQQGINEDGKTVYADSVFIRKSIILNRLDRIDREDSTFYMFVPTARLWEKIYPEAASYFNYGSVGKADSIQNYWSNYSLMQDLVFNPLWQRSICDSIISTTGGGRPYPYHTYYKPFDQGGLMSYATDSVICSNGVIYLIDEWPYDKNNLYFKRMRIEAEHAVASFKEMNGKNETSFAPSIAVDENGEPIEADSISGYFLRVTPTVASSSAYVEYEIPSVLSGTYDLSIILLPKTVEDPTLDPNSTATKHRNAFRPNKFIAEVSYAGLDGQTYSVTSRDKYVIDPESPSYYVKDTAGEYIMECNINPDNKNTRAFVNNPYRKDTVKLATFHFPVCNYAMSQTSTFVKITNAISSKETTVTGYSHIMFVDQILLMPHNDETQQ